MNHKIFIKSAKLPFEQNNVYKIKKHLCWKILNYLFEKPNIKKKKICYFTVQFLVSSHKLNNTKTTRTTLFYSIKVFQFLQITFFPELS